MRREGDRPVAGLPPPATNKYGHVTSSGSLLQLEDIDVAPRYCIVPGCLPHIEELSKSEDLVLWALDVDDVRIQCMHVKPVETGRICLGARNPDGAREWQWSPLKWPTMWTMPSSVRRSAVGHRALDCTIVCLQPVGPCPDRSGGGRRINGL